MFWSIGINLDAKLCRSMKTYDIMTTFRILRTFSVFKWKVMLWLEHILDFLWFQLNVTWLHSLNCVCLNQGPRFIDSVDVCTRIQLLFVDIMSERQMKRCREHEIDSNDYTMAIIWIYLMSTDSFLSCIFLALKFHISSQWENMPSWIRLFQVFAGCALFTNDFLISLWMPSRHHAHTFNASLAMNRIVIQLWPLFVRTTIFFGDNNKKNNSQQLIESFVWTDVSV